MDKLYDVDENAPWRNDPLATRAVKIAREYNIHARKSADTIKPRQMAVIDYGMLLLEVRRQHTSNKKYNEEVLARRLDIPPFDDRRHRTAALAIAESIDFAKVNRSNVANSIDFVEVNAPFDGCDAETAPKMAIWARKTGLILPKKRNHEATPKAREQIRVAVENGQPVNRDAISQATGLSDGAVGRAQAMEQARLEGVIEGEAVALNEQGKLTKAQAKHIDALLKKFRRELDSQFKAAVEVQVTTLVAERKAALDRAREENLKQREKAFKDQQHWQQLINNRKPLLTVEEFRAITMALHPDNSASEETRARALQSFTDKKLQLTGRP